MTKNSKKRRIFSIIILALLCIVLLLAYLQVITTNVKFICLAFLVVIAGMAFRRPDKPFKDMTSHEKYMTARFISLVSCFDYSIYTFLKLKLDMKYGKT